MIDALHQWIIIGILMAIIYFPLLYKRSKENSNSGSLIAFSIAYWSLAWIPIFFAVYSLLNYPLFCLTVSLIVLVSMALVGMGRRSKAS